METFYCSRIKTNEKTFQLMPPSCAIPTNIKCFVMICENVLCIKMKRVETETGTGTEDNMCGGSVRVQANRVSTADTTVTGKPSMLCGSLQRNQFVEAR